MSRTFSTLKSESRRPSITASNRTIGNLHRSCDILWIQFIMSTLTKVEWCLETNSETHKTSLARNTLTVGCYVYQQIFTWAASSCCTDHVFILATWISVHVWRSRLQILEVPPAGWRDANYPNPRGNCFTNYLLLSRERRVLMFTSLHWSSWWRQESVIYVGNLDPLSWWLVMSGQQR